MKTKVALFFVLTLLLACSGGSESAPVFARAFVTLQSENTAVAGEGVVLIDTNTLQLLQRIPAGTGSVGIVVEK